MSARDQMAAMLDELMGPKRNAAVGTDISLNFDDAEVCKLYLVAFCPHEMFVNTKCDLGPCQKIHDVALREAYKRSSRFEKLGYEKEFFRFCTRLQEEMKKRVERNKERCRVANRPMDESSGRALQLDKEITECLEKADASGAAGEIEKSREFVAKAEQLKRERNAIGGSHSLMDEAKPKEVCEVCGCMLIIGDAQQRVEEHLNGKQHVGYTKIGEVLDKLKFREEEERKAVERASREKEKAEREKDREKNEKNGKDREKEKEKDGKDEKKRRDSRDGDRRKDERKRDDGDRKSSDRDRDRERDRDRDRRRHHNDDDRRRRSRSRSHDRRRR